MENLQPHQILVPLAFALAIGFMVLIWGDRPGLAEAIRGLFRTDDTPEDTTSSDAGQQPALSAPTHYVALKDRFAPDMVVAAPVAATLHEPLQPIVMPATPDNDALQRNDRNSALPIEARDIIRATAVEQGKAEAVAALLKSGKLTNKAEAVELVFQCKRNSRPGSTYMRALALVDPLMQVEKYPNRTPDQEEFRKSLELAS